MLRQRVASSTAYKWGATGLFLSAAAILTALAYEHIGGLQPCPLCLQQRWAYYAGIPATFIGLVLLAAGHPRPAGVVFGLVALGFLANAGLGTYHAGVEWGFWLGPDTCSAAAPPPSGTGNLLERLKETPRIVRCDEAPWRFLGLSFAGWNVAASLMLFTGHLKAAFSCREHKHYL